MPKQRLTSLDIHAISSELQSLISYRLQNIYDINSRIFILKFGAPDSKRNVVIESGFRIHLTSFTRQKALSPSHFVAKLRKFLNNRRLTSLFQLGSDRVLVLSFANEAHDERTYHLVFEFFSAGNVILVSSEFKIVHVLRTFRPNVPPGADPSRFQFYETRAHYTALEEYFENPRIFESMTMARLQRILQAREKNEEAEEEESNPLLSQGAIIEKKTKPPKKKKGGTFTIRKALLSGAAQYGAQLVEQVIRSSQVDANTPISSIATDDDSPILTALLKEFKAADVTVKACESPCVEGYIVAFPSKQITTDDPVYEEFMPFKPTNLPPSATVIGYDSFNTAIDTFFSHSEATKLLMKHIQAQNVATTRLTGARADHETRLENLRSIQGQHILKANLLEMNMCKVEEVIASVNGLLARGMDWVDIERLIDNERKRGNPVAEVIRKCDFKNGNITLGLCAGDDSDEEGEDEDDQKAEREIVDIEIDLGLTAWANAGEYFDKKKAAAEKESRTAQSSSKALKNVERKVMTDLKRNLQEEKPLMKVVRDLRWFEKFYWFISSEGYLILGARDSQQAGLLIRKYFRKGDVYVHSELDGACVVVIKNITENGAIPPGTLAQAGVMTIATSRAWDAKQVTSAWWVPYSQIERREGGYDVCGKKIFLPPAMLVLGYGILWTSEDEETMERHARPLFNETAMIEEESLDVRDSILVDEGTEGTKNEQDGLETPRTGSAPKEIDKYNLEQYGAPSDDAAPEVELPHPEQTPPVRRYLSAKQRKDLKKVNSTLYQDKSHDGGNEISSSASTLSPTQPRIKPSVRGKRGKTKKIKARYADQSDEERELARKLLGANTETTKESFVEAENKSEIIASTNKDSLKQDHRPSKPIVMKPVVDEPLEDLNLSTKEFIAAPRPEDIICAAVPICAPWSALSRYKYKVKLTPGLTKKGKVARGIIGGFIARPIDENSEETKTLGRREKELLTSLNDEDIIPCIWPKNVKVVDGSANTLRQRKVHLKNEG